MVRRTYLIGGTFLLILLIVACTPTQKEAGEKSDITENATGREAKELCHAPYYEYKNGDCCLDRNENKICDQDDASEKLDKNATPDLSVEQAAKLFAVAWETENYGTMYERMLPELRAKKSQAQFAAMVKFSRMSKDLISIRFDNPVKENEKLVHIQYTLSTALKDYKLPAFTFRKVGEQWFVVAFSAFFDGAVVDSVCLSEESFNEDCALNIVLELGDVTLCEKTRCKYLPCMKAIEGAYSEDALIKSCYICPPYHSDTVCLTNYGISKNNTKFCDMIVPTVNKMECHINVAFQSNDIEGFWMGRANINRPICDSIKKQEDKKLCIKMFFDKMRETGKTMKRGAEYIEAKMKELEEQFKGVSHET